MFAIPGRHAQEFSGWRDGEFKTFDVKDGVLRVFGVTGGCVQERLMWQDDVFRVWQRHSGFGEFEIPREVNNGSR